MEDGILYQAPSQISGMLVTPIGAAQADPEAWIKHAFLYRTREPDAEPRDLQLSRFTTVDGWGVMLLDGGLGTQARFVAYLAFLDYAATVIAMCRDHDQEPTWREQLLGLVAQAKPDFTDASAVCLAHQLGMSPAVPTSSRRRLPLAGWHRSFAGGDLLLSGDDGPSAGTIRISNHAAPLRTAPEIFAAFLVPPHPDTIVEGPLLDTTDEGEYAVIATSVQATEQHALGIVFAEDQCTKIEAIVRDRAQFARFRAAVHELTYATTLGLGEGRWRRFYYEPPDGWTGVARQRGALWISPTCPRHYQVMRVFDARPPADHERLHGARMFETLPIEFFRDPPKGPVSYWTADDLECRVSVYTGELPHRSGVIKVLDGGIVTQAYVYPIRIECDVERLEDSMRVFERLVASVRTVPARRTNVESGGGAMAFWVD